MRPLRLRLPLLLTVILALSGAGAASAAATPGVTVAPRSATVRSGGSTTLTGVVSGVAPGTPVTLTASPYPYRTARVLSTTPTAASGSFAFIVAPDRSTRYRVSTGSPQGPHASVAVTVIGRTSTQLDALPLGRARVTIVVFHPPDLRWGGSIVHWMFSSGHTGFVPAPSTRTFAMGRSATVLRTVIALPAGRFGFRACFSAPGDESLANPRRPADCAGRGYHGAGSLPAGFPTGAGVARAARYLAQRAGRTAFCVVDSEGRLSGVNVHRTFPTASVVKAMLLVDYLRRLDARGQRRIDPFSASFLYPMIHVSDNNAATQTFGYVGDPGLYAVARLAGMTDFSVNGSWGTALLSPADQARFFFEMDSLIPPEFVGYARFLLSTIEPAQTWGIPPVSRPLGYRTFFKDGSEPTALGQLVHQVDRLEGHHRRLAIAVMTDGDPSMQYGIDTIAGVAAALLR